MMVEGVAIQMCLVVLFVAGVMLVCFFLKSE